MGSRSYNQHPAFDAVRIHNQQLWMRRTGRRQPRPDTQETQRKWEKHLTIAATSVRNAVAGCICSAEPAKSASITLQTSPSKVVEQHTFAIASPAGVAPATGETTTGEPTRIVLHQLSNHSSTIPSPDFSCRQSAATESLGSMAAAHQKVDISAASDAAANAEAVRQPERCNGSLGDSFERTLAAITVDYAEYQRKRSELVSERRQAVKAAKRANARQQIVRYSDCPQRRRIRPPIASVVVGDASERVVVPDYMASSVVYRAPWDAVQVTDARYDEGVRIAAVRSYRDLQLRRQALGSEAANGVQQSLRKTRSVPVLPSLIATVGDRHGLTVLRKT